MECEHRYRVSALHDGELSAESALQMEQHVRSCARCMAELVEIQNVSRSFEGFANDALSLSLLIQTHRAAAAFARERGLSVLKIAGVLTGLAASLLMIASIWLWEVPPASPRTRPVIVNAAPQWERIAMTLDIGPPTGDTSASPGVTASAEARVADWMLENLSR